MGLAAGRVFHGAMMLGLIVSATGFMTQLASAQAVIWGWGPSVGYGYLPPAPIYRPVAPRLAPAPVYPFEFYEPAPYRRMLTAAQVRQSLAARGLRARATPARNGAVYVVDVRDRAGRERRLIVDGYEATILQVFPAHVARQVAPSPGPRLAGRPVNPEIDADMRTSQPSRPSVSGPNDRVRPPQSQRRQPPGPVAAKPPAATATPPVAPMIPPAAAAASPTPTPASGPVLAPPPAPTSPQPIAPALPSSEAALPPAGAATTPTLPTPVAPPAVEPIAGSSEPAAPGAEPRVMDNPEQPAERPRRRVRFIKPDSPTIADPDVPGGQLVPIPEPPPVVVSPRAAEATGSGSAPGGGSGAPSAGNALE